MRIHPEYIFHKWTGSDKWDVERANSTYEELDIRNMIIINQPDTLSKYDTSAPEKLYFNALPFHIKLNLLLKVKCSLTKQEPVPLLGSLGTRG